MLEKERDAKHKAIHNEHVSWLMDQIENLQKENEKCEHNDARKQLIILTHHAPTDYRCIDPFSFNEVSIQMNFSHLEHLFQYPVCAWFFGHTHYNMECIVQSVLDATDSTHPEEEWNTIVASNQQGYLHRSICDRYQIDKVFQFPLKKLSCEVITYGRINILPFLDRAKNLVE
ncbi:hypothetical protein RFI_10042 [Reticulomyxa filosa]|uniref:Calcineurin-like phosphoesterase domain-containing protein n=1 Tax=Reticulomyxa filosa TaxID=46433 RepID=X6NM53_RETFI|nr:hypothetical protein RFI_10042 [Reticulomyxa filosa]|eukprot:ETO27091.1 hypothetical protein RFI_10042 [Reticulomyxa filosa]